MMSLKVKAYVIYDLYSGGCTTSGSRTELLLLEVQPKDASQNLTSLADLFYEPGQ